MFNSNLFTVRNVLVICAFALAWQVIFSRVNAWLHVSESANSPA